MYQVYRLNFGFSGNFVKFRGYVLNFEVILSCFEVKSQDLRLCCKFRGYVANFDVKLNVFGLF
jgi:hypothetical protein